MHYYMFNKPYGCVTAHRDDRYPVVMDYFKELKNDRLSPVGRLDRETVGLLLITDDGIWNQKIIHPKEHIEKTYEFTAMGTLDTEKIRLLENGVLLKGATSLTAPAKVTVTDTNILSNILPTLHPEIQERTRHNRPDHPTVTGRITITEGKKHQIRRMMKAVGCLVLYLKRISVGEFVLDPDLPEGQWKELQMK